MAKHRNTLPKNHSISNISVKADFRFLTNEKFKLEDRIQVQLRFPDEHTQKVLGRICYSDAIDNDRTAYGFSIIDGFYSRIHLKDCL